MSTQAAFAAALLDPQLPCPEGLCSANGADPGSRFSVYRNNVQGSLIKALADSYPVVQQLVGEEFFRAMAAVFVQQQPPASPLMSHYGEAFPAFIDAFEPAASVPYLAGVARLELLHPSLHLLDSNHAVVAIWAAHQGDATLAGIDIHHAQHALVLRNGLDVEVFALEPGANAFLRHLLNDQPLLAAAQNSPPFDLSHTLALLIAHNAIVDLNNKESP
jgi:hypothetical protein